jgi:group I intron endonuclease
MKNLQNKPGIYRITNTVNGKIYFGQSNKIRARWTKHKSKLNKNVHPNAHLQNAWNKHGVDAFICEVLVYCSVDYLQNMEQVVLDLHASEDYCYNIGLDADNPMRGLKMTDEQRKKISEAKKGSTLSEEHRNKISDSLRGYKRNYGKTKCPHCDVEGAKPNMKRFHFDNCPSLTGIPRKAPSQNYEIIKCPYCGLEGTKPGMKRWHFDNCKHKIKENGNESKTS